MFTVYGTRVCSRCVLTLQLSELDPDGVRTDVVMGFEFACEFEFTRFNAWL